MRNTKELLIVFLDFYKNTNYVGLCIALTHIEFTEKKEFYKLHNYIISNLPPRRQDAYCFKSSPYYGARRIRINWLKNQIKHLS